MKLEVGKFYKTRSGKKAKVCDKIEDFFIGVEFLSNVSGYSLHRWSHSGVDSFGPESDDLISEWEEPLKFETNVAWSNDPKRNIYPVSIKRCEGNEFMPLLGKRGKLTFVESMDE